MPPRLPSAHPWPFAAAALAGATLLVAATTSRAADYRIQRSAELTALLPTLRPGDTVILRPGNYQGGITINGLAGTATAPITIAGEDPGDPPVFQSGEEALHLTDCAYLRLEHLRINGFPANGINIDDGGTPDTPSHHLLIEDVTIQETNPVGNHDALKLSGVDDFIVRRCQFESWGGSAIDLVGCHRGVIEICQFAGRDRTSQSSGVQIKGGSSNILVQTSTFRWAGQRAINIGGQTGDPYFRPPGAAWEASAVEIAGNRFFGSLCAVAWASADGGHVHHNTIVFPHRWVLRILQETESPRFAPCANGRFEHNVILYDERTIRIANIGEHTAPETFRFRSNAWHRVSGPRPLNLPVPEEGGLYQVDPVIPVTGPRALHMTATDPRLAGLGADNYRATPAPFTLP